MRELAQALARAFAELIPSGRHRGQALALVAIGMAIPVAELMVTWMFTSIVTTTTSNSTATTLRVLAPQLALFAVLFLATRSVHYGQRIYRVHFFERVFRSSSRPSRGSIESWEWAMAMELMNNLTSLGQLVVMAGFFVVVAPVFGAVNIVLLAVLAEVVGRIFVRQRAQQRGYVERRRAGESVSTFVRLRSRVVAAELGGFVSAGGIVVLLLALIGMNAAGAISAASTIVLFLGLRLQNSTFVNLSGGVMRMARAHANTY